MHHLPGLDGLLMDSVTSTRLCPPCSGSMGLCPVGEGTAWARVTLASQAVPTLGSSHLSLLPNAGCTEVSALMISHPSFPGAPATPTGPNRSAVPPSLNLCLLRDDYHKPGPARLTSQTISTTIRGGKSLSSQHMVSPLLALSLLLKDQASIRISCPGVNATGQKDTAACLGSSFFAR